MGTVPIEENPSSSVSSPSVLKFVFECLSSSKVSAKVCGCVMGMAVNLLTLETAEGGVDQVVGGERMEVEEEGGGGCVLVAKGEDLVAPFVPCLLEYLKRVIRENVGGAGRVRPHEDDRGRRSFECEFVVLSR